MTGGEGLVLFPGLGADAALFAQQTARFPGLTVPGWLEPRPAESLAVYAGRFADQLAAHPPEWVGGSSFGGMVALEVAKRLKPRGVFLIGSARSPRSVSPLFRAGGAVARRLPIGAWSLARRTLPGIARVLLAGNPDGRAIGSAMSPNVSSEFMRWGIGAILDWPGLEDPGIPVHHVHGGADLVMPLSRVKPDRVIPGAGHLLAVTHGGAVNDYLAETMGSAALTR